MTESGALAITGAVIMFPALVCAVQSEISYRSGRWGWAFLSLASACFIAAAWWEVL